MNLETDNFIKHYSENKDEYFDPRITSENGLVVFTSKGIDRQNLVGKLIIVIYIPIIVSIILFTKELSTYLTNFLIVISIVFFFLSLYKQIQLVVSNNNVILDTKKRTIRIIPQDYLRKHIFKSKEKYLSFNSILSIKTRTRNYGKYQVGHRIFLTQGNREIMLVDIWTKKLGNELRDFVQKIIRDEN